jgi:hypothetical protein
MIVDDLRGAEAPLFHVTARFCGSCRTAGENSRRLDSGATALTVRFSG